MVQSTVREISIFAERVRTVAILTKNSQLMSLKIHGFAAQRQYEDLV
jgi:hypothetical protein